MLEKGDSDGCGSRSYFAVFHAVSALFLFEGKSFRKHAQVESEVHRSLVKAGRWSRTLGGDFKKLSEYRSVGDYGGEHHVSLPQAESAIRRCEGILKKIEADHPGEFVIWDDEDEG